MDSNKRAHSWKGRRTQFLIEAGEQEEDFMDAMDGDRAISRKGRDDKLRKVVRENTLDY